MVTGLETYSLWLFVHDHSPDQPEQMRCDMTLSNSMVTTKSFTEVNSRFFLKLWWPVTIFIVPPVPSGMDLGWLFRWVLLIFQLKSFTFTIRLIEPIQLCTSYIILSESAVCILSLYFKGTSNNICIIFAGNFSVLIFSLCGLQKLIEFPYRFLQNLVIAIKI